MASAASSLAESTQLDYNSSIIDLHSMFMISVGVSTKTRISIIYMHFRYDPTHEDSLRPAGSLKVSYARLAIVGHYSTQLLTI